MSTLDEAPQPSGPLRVARSRTRIVLITLVTMLGLTGAAAWYATHPRPLPASAQHTSAVTPANDPIYVGVFTLDDTDGRTLHIQGLHLAAQASAPVEITPWICHGSRVATTSDADTYCTSLTKPAGSTMTAHDSLIVEVTGTNPAAVYIQRPRIGFRTGWQWGTRTVGHPVVVNLIPR